MDLTIKGKLIEVGEIKSGTSKNQKEWKKQNIVLETDGQYPKKVCLQLWNDKVNSLNAGSIVALSFDVESREHNSNWYTDLKVWKFEVLEQSESPVINPDKVISRNANPDALPFN